MQVGDKVHTRPVKIDLLVHKLSLHFGNFLLLLLRLRVASRCALVGALQDFARLLITLDLNPLHRTRHIGKVELGDVSLVSV